jgi:hypothetical protein
MWPGSYMSNSNKFWSFQFPRIQIQSNFAQIASPIFNSNNSLNFEKLQWENLFLIRFSTRPYFIWKLMCKGRQPFDQINVNQFEKYLKIKRWIVRLGRPTWKSPLPLLWALTTWMSHRCHSHATGSAYARHWSPRASGRSSPVPAISRSDPTSVLAPPI